MKKYVTIKDGEHFFRLLSIEESGKDGSIFVRHLWNLHGKSSYHTNHGQMKGPFQFHRRGCAGNVIEDSVDKGRQKFITEYDNMFLSIHFVNNFPKQTTIESLGAQDVVVDISGKNFMGYYISFFSYRRKDLLGKDFDNAVVALVELKTHKIIVGCFNHK
jgi:hypothetical protein